MGSQHIPTELTERLIVAVRQKEIFGGDGRQIFQIVDQIADQAFAAGRAYEAELWSE